MASSSSTQGQKPQLQNGHQQPDDTKPETYTFPVHRLKERQDKQDKVPLVLCACGSYSPITFLHLRMFEMASDYVRFNTDFEVVGMYLSPVSDAYKKVGLAPAEHRVNMCRLAADETSDWLMVDDWEAIHQPGYVPTAQVLDHFEYEINTVRGGVLAADGTSRRPVRIALLAGADLIQTMSTPGVWDEKDLDHILGKFGVFVIERTGTDIEEACEHLSQWEDNIYVIQQVVQNDISSTKVRLFLKRDMSVRYLIPDPVIAYIDSYGLYADDDGVRQKGKDKELAPSAVGASGNGAP